MIILDTSPLVRWIATDPDNDDAARFTGLLKRAKDASVAIGIPAPVFAEFLVGTEEATSEMLEGFERRRAFRVLPFDKRCAHECAFLDRAAMKSGGKKSGRTDSWQSIKIDRQIIAISRVNGVTLLVTEDEKLYRMAKVLGISVTKIQELPIPDDARQIALGLSQADDQSDELDDATPRS